MFGGEERGGRDHTQNVLFSNLVTHGSSQVLELHPEVVQFRRREEDHVKSLHHERGEAEVVLCREDLRQSAVD